MMLGLIIGNLMMKNWLQLMDIVSKQMRVDMALIVMKSSSKIIDMIQG